MLSYVSLVEVPITGRHTTGGGTHRIDDQPVPKSLLHRAVFHMSGNLPDVQHTWHFVLQLIVDYSNMHAFVTSLQGMVYTTPAQVCTAMQQ